MKQLTAPGLTVAVTLSLALLVFGIILNVRNTTQLHEDSDWVIHTHLVMDNLDRLQSRMTDAEANQKEFVATGDTKYLAPYGAAVRGADAEVDILQNLTADNRDQQTRILPLRRSLDAKTQALQSGIDARKAQAHPGLIPGNLSALLVPQPDEVRSLVGAMRGSEQALLVARATKFAKSYRTAIFGAYILGLAGLGAVGSLMLLLSTYAYSRARTASLLFEQVTHLSTILSSIGDAVIVTDEKSCVTSMNPVAESLTGWTNSEAGGLPIEQVFRIVNEESREIVENPATRALREGRVVGLANHTVLLGKDGVERPIEDSAAPVKNAQGVVSGVVFVFRDVTERRATDKAQAILSSIVADSDDAIVSKTLQGLIVTWNGGAERLFGYSAEEAIGRSINLIVPPELWDQELSILKRLSQGEHIQHFETIRVGKDGKRFDVSLTESPLRDRSGRIIGASKVARDFTERKKSEADMRFLAGASASLAGILDHRTALQTVAKLAVPSFADWCAIDMVDANGNLDRVAVAHVDPDKVKLAYELERRYPPDPAGKTGVWRIIRTGLPEHVREISDEMIDAAVADEEVRSVIRELGLNSYMGVPLEVRGEVFGAITFIAAESGRRYSEEDLTIAADLAHRAAVTVQNARMYGALREADNQKDRFLAVLAHELRNPLAPMLYSLEVMKRPNFDPKQLPHAHDSIERQLKQLVRLVDDLLDVSRITLDKLELRRTTVELGSIVRQASETIQPLAEDNGVTVEIVLPARPVFLDGDPTRLAQIFTNLLNNACKFTDRGGKISLTAERDGAEVVVTVKDDGVGIHPTMLPRIFEMFVQVEDSLETAKSGLGIGLMLVRRLVEMHGGSVSASSDGPGTGSVFQVRLPMQKKRRGVSNPRPELAAPLESAPQAGKRILVVDDNKDAAEVLAMLLNLSGHATLLAHDGNAAVEAAEAFRPDVVLMDIGLPVMNGYEVARAIRKQPWGEGIVLVAVTGWGQDRDRQKSRDAGFDIHLVKPVGRDELAKLLNGL